MRTRVRQAARVRDWARVRDSARVLVAAWRMVAVGLRAPYCRLAGSGRGRAVAGFAGRIRVPGRIQCIPVPRILPQARILPGNVTAGAGGAGGAGGFAGEHQDAAHTSPSALTTPGQHGRPLAPRPARLTRHRIPPPDTTQPKTAKHQWSMKQRTRVS